MSERKRKRALQKEAKRMQEEESNALKKMQEGRTKKKAKYLEKIQKERMKKKSNISGALKMILQSRTHSALIKFAPMVAKKTQFF